MEQTLNLYTIYGAHLNVNRSLTGDHILTHNWQDTTCEHQSGDDSVYDFIGHL